MHGKDIQFTKKQKCLHSYSSEASEISYRKAISAKLRATWNNYIFPKRAHNPDWERQFGKTQQKYVNVYYKQIESWAYEDDLSNIISKNGKCKPIALLLLFNPFR